LAVSIPSAAIKMARTCSWRIGLTPANHLRGHADLKEQPSSF
jgi:hypothetical protein